MDINEIVTLLEEKAEDPSTQILDLRNIAIAALETIREAADNLENAIEREMQEDDPIITSDITCAVEDAVRDGVSDLAEMAKDFR